MRTPRKRDQFMLRMATACRNVAFTGAILCGVAGLAAGTVGCGIPFLLYICWFLISSLKVTAYFGFCPTCRERAFDLYFKESDYDGREWEDSRTFYALLSTATDFEERQDRELYFTKNRIFLSTVRYQRPVRYITGPGEYHYYACSKCGKRSRRNQEIDLIGQNWFDASDPIHDWAYRHGPMQAQLRFYYEPLTPVVSGNLKLLRRRNIAELELYYDGLTVTPEWKNLKSMILPGCEIWEYQRVLADDDQYVYGECGVALVRWAGSLTQVEESDWLRLSFPQFIHEPVEVLAQVRQGYFRAAADSWSVI